MPTKRRRKVRAHMGLNANEVQWLTGQPQEGAGKLWWFRQGYPGTIERLRKIIEDNNHLIPPGRMEELERDLERWSGPKPRVIDSFR